MADNQHQEKKTMADQQKRPMTEQERIAQELRENNIAVRDFADFNPKPKAKAAAMVPEQHRRSGSRHGPNSRRASREFQLTFQPRQPGQASQPSQPSQAKEASGPSEMARLAAQHAAMKFEEDKEDASKDAGKEGGVDMPKSQLD